MTRPSDTATDPDHLREELDATALDRLRSSSLVLMGWAVITMVLEVVFFPELRGQSIGFCGLLLALGIPSQLVIRAGRFPADWVEAFGALLLTTRMLHLGLAYFRTGSSLYPLLLLNAMIAGAGISLQLRWTIWVMAVGVSAWTVGLLHHASAAVDLAIGFTIVGSTCVVASVLYLVRARHFFSMKTMRDRDRRRGEELALALAAAERELHDRQRAEEERERLRDQLSHAQKMEAVGTLAGGFAHDLNNMLGVVIGLAELVRESCTGQVREDVDQILVSCRRGADLTRNLLGFSRRGQYRVERLDLAVVVREVSKLLSRTIPKSVTLDVQLDQGAHVVGDSTQLGQLLMNLCLNSVDAMPEGGHLILRVTRVEVDQARAARAGIKPGPHIAMSVADSGCGMDAQTQQRMFEPFFTTRRERGGTGLGLAMVFGTTMKHNGGLIVESAARAGTRITVMLPYAPRSATVRDSTQVAQEAIAALPGALAAGNGLAASAAPPMTMPISIIRSGEEVAATVQVPFQVTVPRSTQIMQMLVAGGAYEPGPIGFPVPRRLLPVTEPLAVPATPAVNEVAEVPGEGAVCVSTEAATEAMPVVSTEAATETMPVVSTEAATETMPVVTDSPAPPAAASHGEGIVPPGPTLAAVAPARVQPPRGHILIVDDEPLVRAVVRRTLRRAGYEVFEATDGMDGVHVFESHRADIDLVLLDMAMPIMGGAACFDRLREIEPTTRVILASGFAAEEEAQRCLYSGALCFLEKPYTSAALLAAVAGALAPAAASGQPPSTHESAVADPP